MPKLRWLSWSESIAGPLSETIKLIVTFSFTQKNKEDRSSSVTKGWALAATNDGNHKME